MNNTLGQVTDEIMEAVTAYHIASMGDDRNEIKQAEANYALMIATYGKEAVQLVVDYYNENIIAKA